jgi:hypothetical protein
MCIQNRNQSSDEEYLDIKATVNKDFKQACVMYSFIYCLYYSSGIDKVFECGHHTWPPECYYAQNM